MRHLTSLRRAIALAALALPLVGCDVDANITPLPGIDEPPLSGPTPTMLVLPAEGETVEPLPVDSGEGETGWVVYVIDGDTIEISTGGQEFRVRYIGMNTPERDEPCYEEARQANVDLVEGQTVRLVKDVSETDRYDRLLRYVYVAGVFVNEQLVRDGWAEVAVYEPDTAFADAFRDLEVAATEAGLGCHPTGIFDDGSYTR